METSLPYDEFWREYEEHLVFHRVWHPQHAPRAGVLLLHEAGLHSGSYVRVGGFLSSHGFGVAAPDLPGQGFSRPRRSISLSPEGLLDLVEDLLHMCGGLFDDVPLFLAGEGAGASLALAFGLMRPDRCAGLILSSPFPSSESLPRRLWGTPFPSLGRPRPEVHGVVDPLLSLRILRDPLCTGKVPSSFHAALRKLLAVSRERRRRLALPVFIACGDHDPLVPREDIDSLYDEVPADERVLRRYRRGGHFLLLDLTSEEVFHDLLLWMEERIL